MYVRSIARLLLVVTCALTALPGDSDAAPVPTDPSALITQLGDQVEVVLNDKHLTAPERQQQFRILLDQDFDFPTISRFVLGRYWQGSSNSFHQEFGTVFEDYVIQSLSARFARYNGESMSVTNTHAEGDRSTVVSTTIIHPNGAPPEVVDWRVEHLLTGYKIIDVNVSGASMAIAYREQFAAVIDHGGGQVAILIPDLQQKLGRAGERFIDSFAAAPRRQLMKLTSVTSRYHAVSVELGAYLDARNVEMHILTDTGKTLTVVFPRDSIFALQKHIAQIGEDCPEIASWNSNEH